MFDVASGECQLVDFLLTRFDPIDLKTKIRFDPTVEVNEQVAPPKPTEDDDDLGATPPPPLQAVTMELNLGRPLPNTAPEATDPADGYHAPATVTGVDAGDQMHREKIEEAVEEQVVQHTPPMTGAAKAPDWLTLIQGFHEAAQRYQEEVIPDKGKENETS